MTAEELPGASVRPLPLGGWLTLFVLLFAGNLYRAALEVVIALAFSSSAYYSHGKWLLNEIATNGEWPATVAVYCYLIWIPLAVFTLKLVLATDRRAPKWVIGLLVLTVLFSTVMSLFIILDKANIVNYTKWHDSAVYRLWKDCAMCVVFVPYFIFSKRVKATFKL
jgi:hypothetical protein